MKHTLPSSTKHLKNKSSFIHPTASIGPNVTFGENVTVGPYCVLTGTLFIDSNTHIYAHVTIGFPAQNVGTTESLGSVFIGKNCHIREFVSIHSPKTSKNKTHIGNNCYIMTYSHIAHDVFLEDNVVITNSSNIGGHVYIEKNVMLMANSALHQFCRVGSYTALAPFSGSRQDLPPFCLFDGQPAKFAGLNLIALKRSGATQKTINALKHVTKLFFQDKLLLAEIYATSSVQHDDSFVQKFLTFIEKSERGVSRKTINNKTSR